jgi:periplasmic glucans biosynthesis protein
MAGRAMSGMDRRQAVGTLLALFGGASAGFLGAGAMAETVDPRPGPGLSDKAKPFSVESLHQMARDLASKSFEPVPQVPSEWRDMSYEQYRSIWFNSNRALWQGSEKPVRLDLFAPGIYFDQPVEISIVSNGEARKLQFDYDLFKKGEQAPQNLPINEHVGYSGFRLRGAVAGPGEFKEFLVFQGASYFRAIARGENYGLSARGLAIRTADERGEEFPRFTKFWIVEPQAGDAFTTIHALLDSPSTTGVYSFEVQPGDITTININATIYPRSDLDHVGIAPLTSMFLFNGTNRSRFDDFRPAVHDSDGLLMWNGSSEVLWRPLANPKSLQLSNFIDQNPKGFGLIQRSRKFSDFADLEAMYHTRPSLWIEPGADWGKGAITLVEIPADKEIYDNVVAYWRPADVLASGSGHSFAYRMFWGGEPILGRDVARVVQTLIGGNHHGEGYTATIDFAAHEQLPESPRDVRVSLTDNRGSIKGMILQRNPETGGMRLAFDFVPDGASDIEMRAELWKDGQVISETWLYRWTA